MTIIETTVILSVLFVLAGAMSPIIGESVTTARAVRAKNDASMIAMALINLQKDLGADALAYSGPSVAMAAARLPEVLATEGNPPQTDEAEAAATPSLSLASLLQRGNGNGNGKGNGNDGDVLNASSRAQRRKWFEQRTGSVGDHLVSNRHGYRFRRPGQDAGWNGPYMSNHIKGDAWGNQYLINSQWLNGGTTAADSDGAPRRAVFVVSAGADGTIQTPFEQPITDAHPFGDDIVVRIQ